MEQNGLASGSSAARLGLIGFGRMGKAIQRISDDENARATKIKAFVVCATTRASAGQNVQADCGIALLPSIDAVAASKNVDVLVDFSHVSAFSDVVSAAYRAKKPLISGTTGLDDKQEDIIKAAGKEIPVLHATNMSLSMALFLENLRITAAALAGVNDCRCHIHEIHHTKKKDAPSGTAKTMAAVIAEAAGNRIPVTITSARLGNVVGYHEAQFVAGDEEIKLEHNIQNRDVFAQGALRAVQWVRSQPPGVYTMRDVLGLGPR